MTEKFLRELFNYNGDLPDIDNIDFEFLPNPDAENWMEDAIINGQDGYAAIHIQSLFGKAALTNISMGNGDVIAYQMMGHTYQNVMWIHDYAWEWAQGGSTSMHPGDADNFMVDWWDEIESLAEAAELVDGEEVKDRAHLIHVIKEEDEELAEMVSRFLEALDKEIPDGVDFPDINIGDEMSYIVRRLTDRQDPNPGGDVNVIKKTAWICENLIGRRNIPANEDDWIRVISEVCAAPKETEDTVFLNRLWASFISDFNVSEMVEFAGDHPWRLVRDSGALIARLLDDPTLGNAQIVTRATLAEQLENERAQQEAKEAAAREFRKNRIEQGVVFLEPQPVPRTFDRGLTFIDASDEEAKAAFPFLATDTDQALANFNGMYGQAWLAKTSTGKLVGFRREDKQDFGWNHSLQVGDSITNLKQVFVKNSYFCDPASWSAIGDFAYTDRGGIHEIDLANGTHRTIAGQSGLEDNAPERATIVFAWSLSEGSLWTNDDDGNGTQLRRFDFVPGGAPVEAESYNVRFNEIHFDDESETLIAVTYELGVLLMAYKDDVLTVYQRVAHEPNTALSQYVFFRRKGETLYLEDHRAHYVVVNLENADKSGGVPLADLIEDWTLIDGVPTG